MCGINGFNFSDPDALRRMHAATRHRGPDSEGFFEAPEISLAHNRLSIIDLSPAGRQPMTTPDGRFTIVFNGEIYNYCSLRVELEKKGIHFQSQSDTEVLLQAFTAWGEESLKKLNGIFAFAIWDRGEARLTLARDQFGVKPLYYFWDGNRLIFSSELKAILAHRIPRDIDRDALGLYFRLLYVPGPRTIFKGISKLLPGHCATLEGSALRLSRYFTVAEGEYFADYADACEKVRATAREALRRQLVSDRPLGVFLSGGIDSSAILGLMREAVSGTIKTFSVGYETAEDQEKFNVDFALARRVAEHYGTEHHAVTLSGREMASRMEKVIWHMDEPVANVTAVSQYVLAEYAKPQITVALGGDGGDELFGGYDRYWLWAFTSRVQSLPAALRSEMFLRGIGRLIGKPELAEKFTFAPGVGRFLSYMAQKEVTLSSVLNPALMRSSSLEAQCAPLFSPLWQDTANQFMAADLSSWLVDESLHRTDRMTMAHGLEERVPLLDLEMVRLAFQIPSSMKLDRRHLGKRILRDALAPYIPAFVKNEAKRGWFSPVAKWLRTGLLPLAREVLSPEFARGSNEYFNLPAAQEMLAQHVAHHGYFLHPLLSIITFRMWYALFMERGDLYRR